MTLYSASQYPVTMMETGVDFAYFDTAPVHFLFAAELSADISQHVSDYQAHSDNAVRAELVDTFYRV